MTKELPDNWPEIMAQMNTMIEKDIMSQFRNIFSTALDERTSARESMMNGTFADPDHLLSPNDIAQNIEEIAALLKHAPKYKTIRYSDLVTSPTQRRLFPESRHRSKRILKKLLKRYHGEYDREPAIIETPDAIYAHSSFRERIENHV